MSQVSPPPKHAKWAGSRLLSKLMLRDLVNKFAVSVFTWLQMLSYYAATLQQFLKTTTAPQHPPHHHHLPNQTTAFSQSVLVSFLLSPSVSLSGNGHTAHEEASDSGTSGRQCSVPLASGICEPFAFSSLSATCVFSALPRVFRPSRVSHRRLVQRCRTREIIEEGVCL